jgi:tetratricopeptide (TPR) repeat protein
MLFIPLIVNAQIVNVCECVEASLVAIKEDKVSRNDEAMQYAYDLFVRDGYGDGIEDFKNLLRTDQEALTYSYNLFVKDGYRKDIEDFKNLIGLQSTRNEALALKQDSILTNLFSWARQDGFKKSKEEFVSLLNTENEVFEYVYKHVKTDGYKKTKVDFAIEIGITDAKILDSIKMTYKEDLNNCKILFGKMTDGEKNKANEEVKNCPFYPEYDSINREKNRINNTLTENDGFDYYFFSGVGKYFADQHNEAITFFNKALELDPKHAGSYSFRGVCKNGSKDYMSAIADFNKAIELGKQDTFVYTSRAVSKSALGDHRGAILDCNIAIGANPEYQYAYNTRAKAKYELKDFKGALLDFNKVIQLDPKDFGAYYNRGLTKWALNDKEGACLDLSKAGELGMAEAYELIREHCN